MPDSRLFRIRQIVGSSSFRIVILFTGFFVLSGIAVTIASGLYSQHLLKYQLKHAVFNEGSETLSSVSSDDVDHLRPVIHSLVRHEPGFYYLLQDASQAVVAGNMLHMQPNTGTRWLGTRIAGRDVHDRLIYGSGYRLQDGGYLFVGIDATPLRRLRHALWEAVAWSSAAFGLLGVAGGLFLSHIILNWIEAISVTARSIMRGNMSRRIPLRGTDDELDHLSHSLNAMLEQNEALISSLRQVSNDIAHDMRRPLARMRNILETACAEETTVERLKERVGLSIEKLDEALEIFSSLLELASLESGSSETELEPLNLRCLIENVLDSYQPVIEDNSGHLLTDLRDVPAVLGQPVLLRQALSNLIENAITHAGTGRTITVMTSASRDHVNLVVCDDGPGIPAASLGRVFDRFVRLDASRTHVGTGLGLSLVRAIIKLHEGTIRLSDNGPGLRCTIQLPVLRSSLRSEERSAT